MQFRKMYQTARLGAVVFMVIALLAASIPVTYAQDDVEEANKAVVARFFEEVVNGGNLDVIDEIIAPGYVEHFAEGDTVFDAPQALKDEWEGILAEFSPLMVTVDDVMADGDRVITRFTASVMDGAAVWTAIGIHRLEDGMIVEFWEQSDQLGMMTQLGLLPEMGEEMGMAEEMAEPVSIAGGFNGPMGVLVDPDGNVWVIDSGLGGDTEVEWHNPDTGRAGCGHDGRHVARGAH